MSFMNWRAPLLGRLLSLGLLSLGLAQAALGATAVRELTWDDLMPPTYSVDELYAGYDASAFEDGDPEGIKQLEAFKSKLQAAPVLTELDGQRVSLPGFALPLEGDSETTTLFLLVPYFGACIHVPPPPANQIVLVRAEKGIAISGLFVPLRVTGRMRVEPVSTDLADAGYSLTLTDVEEIEEF